MVEESNEEIDLEYEDNFVINDTYTILLNRKIGSGSFGQIYQCLNTKTKKIYACKLESINELNPQLYHESKIMNIMKNCTGFPTLYCFCYTEQDKIIVMDYLGANLDTIMNKLPNKKFSIKTALMIMIQCLERLKTLHDKGIIHRDMKPENFVIGRKNKERTIYLIDFGLSSAYCDKFKIHFEYSTGNNFIGTLRYASINAHYGISMSRRDDIESLLYVLIFLAKGFLPWQGVKAKTKIERMDAIRNIKFRTTCDELTVGLPGLFKDLLTTTKKLKYEEKPNYGYYKWIFSIMTSGENSRIKYEWINEVIKLENAKKLKELYNGYPLNPLRYLRAIKTYYGIN